MIAVDFFCGAGGLTRGLMNAGIPVAMGIDSDERCRKTYIENNRGASFLTADIRDLTFVEMRRRLGRVPPEELLFAGCAPCQPFSQQKKSGGDCTRGTLLGRFGEFVDEFRPGQVLIENVPGIARVPGFSTYRRFLKMLEDRGYEYADGVLDAKSYGVPQNRDRYVLIALLDSRPTLPPPTHGPDLQPYATVRDAIMTYPRIRAGKRHPEIPNHVSADISLINMERLRHTPRNGGDRRSWPTRLVLACHKKEYDGHTDVYGRMRWDKPAPALTGRCHSISNGRYGHPSQNRAISLREAASLQTFPDDYVFFGSNKHIALQIGNAVPVKLGEQIARHILALRNGIGSSRSSKARRHGRRTRRG
jgi:DNA (cytosine-5)-methyltransferase 1